ncbi:MAG: SDR family NAD(P)-dependent oxidoreductase [Spirochaetaceae bacterium]
MKALGEEHIVGLLLRAYAEKGEQAGSREEASKRSVVYVGFERRREPNGADRVLRLPETLREKASVLATSELHGDTVREAASEFFQVFDGAGITDASSVYVPELGTYHVQREVLGTASEGKLPGKVAVVTGAAQGFGAAIAEGLATNGARVCVADIDAEAAAKKADEISEKHGSAVSFGVDVGDEESVAALLRAVCERWGRLEIFVSNAGVLRAGSVLTLSARDLQMVTTVNYLGFFYCTKYAGRVMAVQNHAAASGYTDIIQINSKSGLEGSKKNGAYAGSKFGGIGLTQSFALELIEHAIKVNAVCPGNFFEGPLWSDPDSGLFVQYLRAGKVPGARSIEDVRRFYESKVPMGRGCRGSDVLRALLYLLEQEYETGQAVPVTGGQTMLS